MASDGTAKDRKKKKRKNGQEDYDAHVIEETTTNVSCTEQNIVKKKKKKTEEPRQFEISKIDSAPSEERTSKKEKKKRKTEDENVEILVNSSIVDEHNSTNLICTEKRKREKMKIDAVEIPVDDSMLKVNYSNVKLEETKEKLKKAEEILNVDLTHNTKDMTHSDSARSFDQVSKIRDTKNPSSAFTARSKNKMKTEENNSIKKLLKQKTNVGSEMQVKRIRGVRDEVFYDEVIDELVQNLRKKIAKKAKFEDKGNKKKITELDEQMEKLKKEAVEKASELNSNAMQKLASIENSIIRKIKKKRRKKSFAINGMAQDRFSKGKTGMGAKCQDGIAILDARSKEARSEVKQAAEETKKDLEKQFKAFAQRIENLEMNMPVKEPDFAFSGAISAKGYLC